MGDGISHGRRRSYSISDTSPGAQLGYLKDRLLDQQESLAYYEREIARLTEKRDAAKREILQLEASIRTVRNEDSGPVNLRRAQMVPVTIESVAPVPMPDPKLLAPLPYKPSCPTCGSTNILDKSQSYDHSEHCRECGKAW